MEKSAFGGRLIFSAAGQVDVSANQPLATIAKVERRREMEESVRMVTRLIFADARSQVARGNESILCPNAQAIAVVREARNLPHVAVALFSIKLAIDNKISRG